MLDPSFATSAPDSKEYPKDDGYNGKTNNGKYSGNGALTVKEPIALCSGVIWLGCRIGESLG